MRREDEIRLRHMLEAAQEACRFALGASRPELDSNRLVTFAVVRALEIIGEAARKVSENARNSYPDLPWDSMVGMRHRLIHAYFDVDVDRVWDTITQDLPPLIARLQEILGEVMPDSR